MSLEHIGPFDLLMRRETVLVTFVGTALVSAFATGMSAESGGWIHIAMAVVVFPLLAWFTHKKQLLATWCTLLLLILNGSGYLYDAFSGFTADDGETFAVLIIKAVVGIYLTWGALMIHRERHIRD